MSSCAGGEQRAYDGSALQRKALTAEEAKVKNREKAKRSADKKKEAHAAALKEADDLRTDNASLRTRNVKLTAESGVKDTQIAVRAAQVAELQSQVAGLQAQLRKQVRPLLASPYRT